MIVDYLLNFLSIARGNALSIDFVKEIVIIRHLKEPVVQVYTFFILMTSLGDQAKGNTTTPMTTKAYKAATLNIFTKVVQLLNLLSVDCLFIFIFQQIQ